MCNYNTDMADERIDEYKTVKNLSSIDGIEVKQTTYDEFKITEVNVLNENGKNAIEKAKKNKYDIIFLDDLMPKLSGKETLDELKKLEDFNTPVVCITANVVTGIRDEYLNNGFDEYLAKPIEKEELQTVLNKILKKES